MKIMTESAQRLLWVHFPIHWLPHSLVICAQAWKPGSQHAGEKRGSHLFPDLLAGL